MNTNIRYQTDQCLREHWPEIFKNEVADLMDGIDDSQSMKLVNLVTKIASAFRDEYANTLEATRKQIKGLEDALAVKNEIKISFQVSLWPIVIAAFVAPTIYFLLHLLL